MTTISDPARFPEAVQAWRARVPVAEDQLEEISGEARERAFTVAGVANLELLADVWRALDAAIARGESFEDFKAKVGDKLAQAWGRDQPWRLQTIFRTNAQVAYGEGRYRMLTDPAVLRRRPFWKFSAVLDGRTSPICRPLQGTVLPASDPWWNDHQPPLHFSCRSTVMALTPDDAESAGIAKTPPDVDAQEGFGQVGEELRPDLSNFPKPLRDAYEKLRAEKEATRPKPPPKVEVAPLQVARWSSPPQTLQEHHRRMVEIGRELFGADFTSKSLERNPDILEAGRRHFDGRIELNARGADAIKRTTQSKRPLRKDLEAAQALSTVVHEELHGLGRWSDPHTSEAKHAYATEPGRVLEEGAVELLATLSWKNASRRIGFSIADDAKGPRREWRKSGLFNEHAYKREVGVVESLMHFAAGSAEATPKASGNLSEIALELLRQFVGQWQKTKRISLLAERIATAEGKPDLAPVLASIIERSLLDQDRQEQLHQKLWDALR